MPALLLLAVILLVPLLAGCVPGSARSDGIPTADAPFTLTALDVGQSTFRFRCIRRNRTWNQRGQPRGESPLIAALTVAGK